MESPSAVKRITLLGMAVNVLLTAFKLAIGLLFHSQACVADAVHSMSDCITDLAVIIGVKYWSEPADANHPHGHQRIESLTTLFIALALGYIAIKICFDAIYSIGKPVAEPGWPIFYAAMASIFVKEILYHVTIRVGKATRSSALIANAWHHRSDAFSSVPVAITAILCRLYPGQLDYLDAFAAILVSIMLFVAAIHIAWPALQELADMGANSQKRKAILKIAHEVPGIKEIHKLRTRRVGSGYFVDLHILVPPEMTVKAGHDICNLVTERLLAASDLSIIDVFTHLEPWDDTEKRGDQNA